MTAKLFPQGVPAAKRIFDLVLVIPGLILISPIMGVLFLILWLTQGRPILFCQERPGLHGQIFKLCKFRSMRVGVSQPDEKRITRLGRFLRSSSLDELPELVNVLRGEMSLVGPRPLLVAYLDRYNEEQARRHDVLPGITGWAQINGRNVLSWEDRFEMDVWYVDNWSLWLDIRILLLTIWKVLRREGIDPQGGGIMTEFQGSEGQRADKNIKM